MLQSLRIRNLALLEEIALDFESGFNVVTGETGAGKSILLGALSILAGQRADKTMIRQGASSCEVEASLQFVDSRKLDEMLLELDLPVCEEGVLIIRRSLYRDKAPRISVNGSLTTLAALQKLGEYWIDFHGPSEPRRLLKESCQLEMLDLYAKNQGVVDTYVQSYRAWRELTDERQSLANSERLSPDQIAFLEKQVSELDKLDLAADSVQALERDFQRLSRAQELREFAAGLTAGLGGDDGIAGKMASLIRMARHMEAIDASCKSIADRLSAAAIELADVAEECSSLDQSLQFGEEESAEIQEKMDAWLAAKRRYGGDVATVARKREELKRQLASQGDIEGTLARLDARISDAHAMAVQRVRKLRATREKAAAELAKTTSRALSALGFKKAEFDIQITQSPNLGPQGDCSCLFLFSPNLGEAPLPLHRIASSGELARVMLALKTVLAGLDAVPVLVFDEVDANVGGEIGRVVGEKMASISAAHQVFCVTHLPQVAAFGSSHLVVEKTQEKGRTTVSIKPIHKDRSQRVLELARMLGDRNARSARSHAEELLGSTA